MDASTNSLCITLPHVIVTGFHRHWWTARMHEMHDSYLLPVLTVTYILSTLTMSVVWSECVFDKVQPTHVPSTFVQYLNKDRFTLGKHRHKRDLTNAYQPIRIHVEFHDLDSELSPGQQENLKNVVMETIKHVTQIFKGRYILYVLNNF